MVTLPTTMKTLRLRTGLNQEQFAQKLGVSVSTVSKWDQGQTFPLMRPKDMVNLMAALECTIDELCTAQDCWEGRSD